MRQNGVVSEVYPKLCGVILDTIDSSDAPQKTIKFLCSYRRAQVFERDAEWRERSPVAPGDKVVVEVLGSRDGVIEEVLPRENCIQRRAPGKEGKILHTLAANVDYVVIVASLHQPEFSPGLIDRFLIGAIAAGIAPALVINKMDLQASPEDEAWEFYRALGVRCYPISAKLNGGFEPLKALLHKKTSVFCGHSGVGKTSLLHKLFGMDMGKIGAVNVSTGKGKHTTSVSTLVQTPDHSRFIDTPGVKEFGLVNVDPEDLIQYFPELYTAQQKKESLEKFPRFESYLRIKAALEDEGR